MIDYYKNTADECSGIPEELKPHIAYDFMQEAWVWFREESDFRVPMTPDGPKEDLDQKFMSEEEFWEWYNS